MDRSTTSETHEIFALDKGKCRLFLFVSGNIGMCGRIEFVYEKTCINQHVTADVSQYYFYRNLDV